MVSTQCVECVPLDVDGFGGMAPCGGDPADRGGSEAAGGPNRIDATGGLERWWEIPTSACLAAVQSTEVGGLGAVWIPSDFKTWCLWWSEVAARGRRSPARMPTKRATDGVSDAAHDCATRGRRALASGSDRARTITSLRCCDKPDWLGHARLHAVEFTRRSGEGVARETAPPGRTRDQCQDGLRCVLAHAAPGNSAVHVCCPCFVEPVVRLAHRRLLHRPESLAARPASTDGSDLAICETVAW